MNVSTGSSRELVDYDHYSNVGREVIICLIPLSVGICGSSRWSWRTPCAERSAFQMTTAPSLPLRDFPNREQLGTTVNEHSSSLPLSPSLSSRRDVTQCKQETEEFGSAPKLIDSTSALLRVTLRKVSDLIYNFREQCPAPKSVSGSQTTERLEVQPVL